MKNLKAILSIGAVFLLTLTGCNKQAPKIILPANGENNYVSETEPGKIYLNLTSIGLYDGSRGVAIADSNLDYGKVITGLTTGDNLPKDEITSSSANVSFYKWCYYKDGGVLSYTDKVVKNIDLYQAAFVYEGNYKPATPTPETTPSTSVVDPTVSTGTTPITTVPEPTLPPPTTSVTPPPTTDSSTSTLPPPTTDSSTSTLPPPTTDSSTSTLPPPTTDTSTTTTTTPITPTTPDEPSSVVTYNFYDKGWWNAGAAESWVYIFDSKGDNPEPAAWPGVQMTWVQYLENTNQNLWTFEIDLSLYDTVVISRRKTVDGIVQDWNSQTADVVLSAEFNTITLWDNSAWNSDGNKAQVSLTKS